MYGVSDGFDLVKNTICAVVVTFNPSEEEFAGLQSDLIAEELPYVVVDNASATTPAVVNAEAVITNEVNQGLGAALNAGISAVKARGGYQSVLLLDQDSRLSAGFLAGMQRAASEARVLGGKVSVIGPMLKHPETGAVQSFRSVDRLFSRHSQRVEGTQGLYWVDFLITSGSLISLQALEEVGPMREDYFIDNIDLEWCFRARAKGYQAYGTDHCCLLHRIGEAHPNGLVRRGLVKMHNPERVYYSTRNRFHLYGQAHAGWLWKCRDFPRFLLKTGFLLLFSTRRKEYLKNTIAGLRDARRLSNEIEK